VLMTTLVAMVGLLPAALSNGIGAQSQKPLAVVVIGGCLILAVLSRVIPPRCWCSCMDGTTSEREGPSRLPELPPFPLRNHAEFCAAIRR